MDQKNSYVIQAHMEALFDPKLGSLMVVLSLTNHGQCAEASSFVPSTNLYNNFGSDLQNSGFTKSLTVHCFLVGYGLTACMLGYMILLNSSV
jgi:hypothetical protein